MRAGTVLSITLLVAGCGEPSLSEPQWTQVFSGLSGALLSVTGTGDADVWAVGSSANDGKGPLVLHYDGTAWTREATGITGDLWWVHAFPNGPVFFGGSKGTIVRYDKGAFRKETTPTETTTVYGIWGSAANDIWAVGGDGDRHGFVWHFDGQRWSVPAGLPANIGTTTHYKVWGTSKSDVWIVGGNTRAIHYDGKTFKDTSGSLTSSERPLFTIHGSGSLVAAVGGFASGFLMERNGSEWVDRSPSGVQTLSGIFIRDNDGYAVGARGGVVRRANEAWTKENLGDVQVREDLHSVWVSPKGNVWAVGGQVLQPPLVRGVMLFKGLTFPSGQIKQ